jgi:hypothetical protein
VSCGGISAMIAWHKPDVAFDPKSDLLISPFDLRYPRGGETPMGTDACVRSVGHSQAWLVRLTGF